MICWFQYTIIMTRSQYMYRRYVKAERTPPVGARRRRVCRGAGSGRESGGTVAEGRRLACVWQRRRGCRSWRRPRRRQDNTVLILSTTSTALHDLAVASRSPCRQPWTKGESARSSRPAHVQGGLHRLLYGETQHTSTQAKQASTCLF